MMVYFEWWVRELDVVERPVCSGSVHLTSILLSYIRVSSNS